MGYIPILYLSCKVTYFTICNRSKNALPDLFYIEWVGRIFKIRGGAPRKLHFWPPPRPPPWTPPKPSEIDPKSSTIAYSKKWPILSFFRPHFWLFLINFYHFFDHFLLFFWWFFIVFLIIFIEFLLNFWPIFIIFLTIFYHFFCQFLLFFWSIFIKFFTFFYHL